MGLLNINVNLYRSFLAVYKHQRLSLAADELFTSAPKISKNLRELEKQLNIPRLFVRQSRGVAPTSEAIALHPKVETAFNLLTEASQEIQSFDENSEAIIRFAMPSPIANIGARDYITNFCRDYPKVQFDLFPKDGGNKELLANNKIDFIIEAEHLLKDCSFKKQEVYSEKLVIIASKTFLHERELSTIMTKEEFLKLPLVCHKEFINEFSIQSGLKIKPYIRASISSEVFDAVKTNMGLGIYYQKTLEQQQDENIVTLEIEGLNSPIIKVVCAYKKEYLSKATRVFLEGLVKVYQSN